MTHYRLDRAFVMLTTGVCFIVSAVAVLALFLSRGSGVLSTVVTVIAGIVLAAALLLAAVLNVKAPVVLTLDAVGYRTRGRGNDGRWQDVADVALHDGVLQFTDAAGTTAGLPLQVIEHRRHAELIAEVYERLNTAHGYERFEFDGE